MALIDKASLLFVPSVVAEGKAFNVLPSGNRAPDSTDQNSGYDQTRADFDFDRGSNTAATRIGSDGLIKKYRENLLTESNNFSDSDWTKSAGGSFTSGQPDKDGGTDAWKFNSTTAANSGAWQNVTLSSVATFSAYFKKGTLDKIAFVNFAGNSYECYFDLENGVIEQQTGDLINAKIEAVGTDGWYRCSITDIASGTNYLQLKPTDNLSGTATQSGYIYIQNAQLESGLVSTDYLDSTSVTGKAGVLVDLPRINYDANGENGSLLLEPSRQNKIQYSEYFGGWTNAGTTATLSNTTNPSGDAQSYVISATSSATNALRYDLTFSASTDYSYSLFLKAGTSEEVRMQIYDGNTYQRLAVNPLNAFAVVDQSGINSYSIEDYGNGWYRVVMNFTTTASASSGFLQIYPDRTGNLNNVEAWGAQLEASASYPSSYIPNNGESGGVTRAADSCSVTGVSDVIGQSEGTMYWEGYIDVSKSSYGYFPRLLTTSSSSSNWMGILLTQSNELRAQYVVSGSTDVQIKHQISTSGNYKIAFAYNDNDFNCFVNGVSVGTNTSVATTIALNDVYIGMENGATLAPTSQDTKKAILFNEALSDSELATLTTL